MKIDRTGVAILITGIALTIAAVLGSTATARGDAPRLTATHTQVGPPPVPRWMTRPCAQEDSVNCFWNARTMGNGHGHSFYVRRMPGDITGLTCIFYSQPRFASNHDHCWLR